MAVVGLGGIGKTQVALSFAYSVVEKHPDTSVFWLPALSTESYEQAMKEISELLGIRMPLDSNEDEKVLLKRNLSSPKAGKWLLIVDNADDVCLLERSEGSDGLLHFLPESSLGVIVFTTRTSGVAQRVAGSNVLKLKNLERGEADSLLKRSLTNTDLLYSEIATTELLVELDYLPLAITQAAAYININELAISEYVQLLRGTVEDREYLMSVDSGISMRYEQSDSAVATTWLISFQQLNNRHPAAADLLQFISCIEWKAIPRSILPAIEESQALLTTAIGTLISYSFLTKRNADIYDMHRLVHLASRIWLHKFGHPVQVRTKLGEHILKIFPPAIHENTEIWRSYLSHVFQLNSHWVKKDADEDSDDYIWRSPLEYKVGRCLRFDGRFDEALEWFQNSYDLIKDVADNYPLGMWLLQELVQVYLERGQIADAIQLNEELVKVMLVHPEDHPDRLASLHSLAQAYLANWQIAEAIQMFDSILTIRKKTVSEDNHTILASQHELARAYLTNEQTTDAIQLFEHIVAIKGKTLDDDHPDLLLSQRSLAVAYLTNRQIMDAIGILERIDVLQKTLPEDHPNRLGSQHTLAHAYLSNGQTMDAIRIFERVVSLEKTLPEDHHSRINSQQGLAQAYIANGQTMDAIRILERIVALQKALPEDNPSRLVMQHELARAYLNDGQMANAIQLFEYVFMIKKALGEDSPSRLVTQYELARAYLTDGYRITEAIELLEPVVAIWKKTLAENDSQLIQSQVLLAYAYKAKQKKDSQTKLIDPVNKLSLSTSADVPNRGEISDKGKSATRKWWKLRR